MTPQEAWCGQKPSIHHFKIFGSLAYDHVLAQLRMKLDDRSKKYILIGYDEKAKSYKLYNPITGKILVSRDVQVDEESEWSWSNSEKTSGSSNSENESSEIIRRSSEITRRSSDRTNEHSEEDDEPEQLRTQSLQDIYNSTDELHVVCLLTGTKDIKFEEAVLNERWKKAMDEEIGSIEKSEMGSKAELVEEFKEVIKREFEMTDLGIMKYFLGLEVDQRTAGHLLFNKNYSELLRSPIIFVLLVSSFSTKLWDNKKEMKVTRVSGKSDYGVYGICGPFTRCNAQSSPICSCLKGFEPSKKEEWDRQNWTSGCIRSTGLQCERTKDQNTSADTNEDGFLKLQMVKVPDFPKGSPTEPDLCKSQCLEDCSCIAYSHDDGIGCMSWIENLLDIQQFSTGGLDLYVRVAYTEVELRMLLVKGISFNDGEYMCFANMYGHDV
ncbi:uncharacterized protein LOC109813787 [Cajanus cajan]|uniref:uncharacterized protein LOC109813787 n=1 Tax=Cajanus cajan TaxID=3821 RepID=UPI00098D8C11|nr:uncharacterized protein LOC109813787 [Cajanus cajan]